MASPHSTTWLNVINAMNLKRQLTYYLEVRGITGAELCRRAKVPKQSLSGWMAGNSPRDLTQLKRVADALDTSIDNLLFGTGTDSKRQQTTELEALVGEGWVSGIFEVRLRRIKKEELK